MQHNLPEVRSQIIYIEFLFFYDLQARKMR